MFVIFQQIKSRLTFKKDKGDLISKKKTLKIKIKFKMKVDLLPYKHKEPIKLIPNISAINIFPCKYRLKILKVKITFSKIN